LSYLTPALIILGLIVLNGVFVAAEFALIGVPRHAIESRAARGHRVAKMVSAILNNPRRQDQYIATAQLGITFASLGLGMYGEQVVAAGIEGWLSALGPAARFAEHTVASVMAVAFLTYLHIVFGEMIPKSLALQHAEGTSLWIAPVVSWVRRALFPLVLGLNGLGNALLRVVGIERTPSHAYHTPEELEAIVEESESAGALDPRSARFMRELLRLRELTADEIMIPRVRTVGLELGCSSDQLKGVLQHGGYSRYPVFETSLDNIIGFMHVKDLLPVLLAGRTLLRDQVRPVPFVPQSLPADDVVDVMRTSEAQMVVVMDEHGGTAGVVTEKDLIDRIVGEIHEDGGQPDLWRDVQGRLHAAGTALLSEVGEELGIELEYEEVDTVSGLVLTVLEGPPKVGDAIEYAGVRFEVTAVSGHGVANAIVEVLPEKQIPTEPRAN
jgi:CBS domain containing-hemolysin-like protein